ncbi:SDR family oxidoreductase [Hwanghaeella grinnelliae]|uniref:SDR family oxidoreductase n=1 Tax=Hwanghaeella grinnelliae TaxID=2500179 RepID=A0A3S2WUL2_9PROT|nr:SDR family NAD(P)-dependent oxidoreductase [Hwanghaeella grinnelliae]RVU38866.1 SDR family oxidoreductase [Hwanghaeella grinnelliae]
MTMPVYDYAGKKAVVTGGSSGIGKAIAERLRDAGAAVQVWDLSEPTFDGVTFAAVDVSKPDMVTAAAKGLDGVDLLVNSAGFTGPSEPLVDLDPAMWRRVVDVNLIGVYEVCRNLVPIMQRQGNGKGTGRIVNIASLAGKEGTPNASAYSAAKAGVIGLTKSLGKELAQTDIRVNSLAPAAVDSPILAQMSPDHVQIMIDKSPMKRLGTVDEVAEMVLWMLSDACTFSTGAAFDLSGGRATY